MKRRWKKLLGMALILVLAWFGWDHPAVWPLKVLVVLFHELGHALAALATGGEVLSISLSPDEGGVTRTRGGLRFFVLSAGYMGSLAFGVLWLFLGRSPRTARFGVWVLAACLLGATLVWVRPWISFGFVFGVVASMVALVVAQRTGPASSQWILRVLGVFSVLYALWDIRDDVILRDLSHSDAGQLAALTHIPGPVWGVVWIALGLGVLFALRRWF